MAVPPTLTKKVSLKSNLIGYLEAFYELDTERHHTESLMRIPWSCIMQYAEHYGMPVEETVYFIRRMDDAHIRKLAERRASERDGTKSSGSIEVVQRPPRPD